MMPEPVTDERCLLGESPLWCPDEQALYWVDIKNSRILRLDPATGAVQRWLIETDVGCIGRAGPGRLIAGLRSGFVLYDLASGTFERIVDPEPEARANRLNDGKVDPNGRFWAGTMQDPRRAPVGALWRLDPDGACRRMLDRITVPNALAWSPDGRTMYFADSPARRILAYEFDAAAGTIANPRLFAELAEGAGNPDGATVDSEGFLWNAHFNGGRVTRYAPDGTIDRVIELPVRQVTSCAFGGAELKTLYITTASMGLEAADLAAEPLAGRLFALDPGVAGRPEPVFGG